MCDVYGNLFIKIFLFLKNIKIFLDNIYLKTKILLKTSINEKK